MMKKTGLCLLALVLMARSIQMATAFKGTSGPHNAKGKDASHPSMHGKGRGDYHPSMNGRGRGDHHPLMNGRGRGGRGRGGKERGGYHPSMNGKGRGPSDKGAEYIPDEGTEYIPDKGAEFIPDKDDGIFSGFRDRVSNIRERLGF